MDWGPQAPLKAFQQRFRLATFLYSGPFRKNVHFDNYSPAFIKKTCDKLLSADWIDLTATDDEPV